MSSRTKCYLKLKFCKRSYLIRIFLLSFSPVFFCGSQQPSHNLHRSQNPTAEWPAAGPPRPQTAPAETTQLQRRRGTPSHFYCQSLLSNEGAALQTSATSTAVCQSTSCPVFVLRPRKCPEVGGLLWWAVPETAWWQPYGASVTLTHNNWPLCVGIDMTFNYWSHPQHDSKKHSVYLLKPTTTRS